MSLAANVSPLPDGDEYLAFCAGILRLCHIDLALYKRAQMERRLRSFAERRGKTTLLDYLALLASDRVELDLFLDRMTINVSQLWRNPVQWETLATQVIPQLVKRGRIRAWSAGCSYGAEAYTLAAICREVARSVAVEIHGSDIDARMIERAREGRFSEADLRSVPPHSVERWFTRTADGWQVVPELMALAEFKVEDLLECPAPAVTYDLITCRNLVIYFTDESRVRLHRKLAGALREGGCLMIGSTERIIDHADYGLELIYPFTYRKV